MRCTFYVETDTSVVGLALSVYTRQSEQTVEAPGSFANLRSTVCISSSWPNDGCHTPDSFDSHGTN